MPFITGVAPPVRPVMGVVAALAGMKMDAFAPRGTDISGVPTPSYVVAWALVADESEVGGSRVEPVFLADGRTWTPDQFRAFYGAGLELKVVPC